jgi:hypothetical protein
MLYKSSVPRPGLNVIKLFKTIIYKCCAYEVDSLSSFKMSVLCKHVATNIVDDGEQMNQGNAHFSKTGVNQTL